MPKTSASSAHDSLAGYTLGGVEPFSTGFENISNAAPLNSSFTPTTTGTYDVTAKAGSFVTGGGGALRFILRMSVNPPATPTSYFGDVFDSDNENLGIGSQTSFPTDFLVGQVNLTAGTTYYVTMGGGGGTTGGNACVDITFA